VLGRRVGGGPIRAEQDTPLGAKVATVGKVRKNHKRGSLGEGCDKEGGPVALMVGVRELRWLRPPMALCSAGEWPGWHRPAGLWWAVASLFCKLLECGEGCLGRWSHGGGHVNRSCGCGLCSRQGLGSLLFGRCVLPSLDSNHVSKGKEGSEA
jgi:hypothetical protein